MRKLLVLALGIPLFIAPIAVADECPDPNGCSQTKLQFERSFDNDAAEVSVTEETVVPGYSEPGGRSPVVPEVVPPSVGEGRVEGFSGGGSPFSAENLHAPSEPVDCEVIEGQIAKGACAVSQIASIFSRSGGSDEEYVSATPREPVDPSVIKNVPTRRIVNHARGFAGVEGAGLVVEPYRHKITKIPVVVHASQPRQVKDIELFGRKITVTFQATSFTFNFNDDTDPLVSATPGAPYPSMELKHIYLKPNPAQTVTLTTTWDVTLTNPWTGETSTTKDALVTTETSDPFRLYNIHTYLTDTAEEQAGH